MTDHAAGCGLSSGMPDGPTFVRMGNAELSRAEPISGAAGGFQQIRAKGMREKTGGRVQSK